METVDDTDVMQFSVAGQSLPQDCPATCVGEINVYILDDPNAFLHVC